MMIEVVRISEKGKQQLTQLKRKTGIENWNTLCRWALCTSLAEPSIPPIEEISSYSNIEMTWKTFAGQNENIYDALIRQRMIDDNLPLEDEYFWLRIHLHRGISYLFNNTHDINSLIQ